ncbi:MAG: hypothetical protein QXX26_05915 [Desulfurococcaceae archaeon]
MDRLVFESIPIEYLDDVLDELVITPLIGVVEAGFNKSIDVVFRYSAQPPPSTYPVSSVRVFYIIHYPRNFLKIGSSSINNVTGRVFSQAPIAGLLSIAVMLKHEVSVEEMERVEEECVDYLNKVLNREVNDGVGGRNIEVYHRRGGVFNEVFENYLKNLVEGSVETRVSFELLREISEYMVKYVIEEYENIMEPLYPPNICLFKTSIDEDGVRILKEILYSKQHVSLGDLSELRHTCINRNCRGSITILKNGICILRTKIHGVERYFIVPCDTVQYNLLIKIINNGNEY